MNIKSAYDCPNCGKTAPDFDGTYYAVVDGELVYDLSDWDIKETGLPVPEEYFPKFGESKFVSHPDYFGYDWEETHKCPACGTIFSFINSSY